MLHFEEQIDHVIRCPMCGRVVAYGRKDRRFCSIACKNRWHNRMRFVEKEKQRGVRYVMRILYANRDVLEKLLKIGLTTLDRLSLIHMGFNMCYFTSLEKIRHRWVYSCLDIQYELTPTRIKNIRFLWEGADDMVEEFEEEATCLSSQDL